ncbi:MAG: hypothetical protein QHH74_09785 [Spirochaetota bacterium]|nr:hypothetical protein [Spirochaetota bacterium]
MKTMKLWSIVVILLLSISQVFAANIDIGPQPYPNLYINTPAMPLQWFEMYTNNQGNMDIGGCYSNIKGDAIDGKHVGLGISGIFNVWGPYLGIALGPTIDFSWGNLYDNDKLKYFVFSLKLPVSLLVQVVRIENAAVNIYAGGDVSLMDPRFKDINGDEYSTDDVGFSSGVIPYGYHIGIQATGKYAALALGIIAGMQSAKFNETKLGYDNIDDGNLYYFKLPAETVNSYFYGIKLTVIPWDVSISYTTQTVKKSSKTGFPEYSQHSIMVSFLVAGVHSDVKEEKKEEKPKQKVDTL